ncbi:DUF885 domain-containing protein [Corynebacterium pilosum]|uniref:Bacterial protein of uncharacterized function (DUF885) n=1 Tax=Corynebacterium pilosum TaxID=35756 RepID=A0A376CLP5_9CORY|nr:DUF885 domain-containing protein [Corynebacterium pilosum]STC69344.1 Bacterial protein of uncharacterised function (DUF885) [Corynebacterium pilosum]
MTSQSSDFHSESEMSEARQPSLLDATCENFVYDMAEISPTQATELGLVGYDDQLQDFSPEYWDSIADRIRDLIADVDALNDGTDDSDDDDDFDDIDHVTAAILRDRLGLQLELHHQGEWLRLLNNIESPVQTIRDTFLLMPRDTPEQLDNIAARLSQVAHSLHGYRESLAEAASQGSVAAHRQIDAVISQCEELADEGSMLEGLGVDPESAPVDSAKQAFSEMADWLSTELSPLAPHEDAFGRERYELFSEYFLGFQTDLDEAYEWGLERLHAIVGKQKQLARTLYDDDCPVRVTYRRLNEEPRYRLDGVEALQEWMQKVSNRALEELDGTHFTIPEELKTLECKIDPAGSGGIFYTPPSDDFARPGSMWWSVPKGQNVFHTWQELSTVYHEGVPGHHLQLGVTLTEKDNLNLWRRAVNWHSGHGEGWALYAESLMAEFGYLQDPGFQMGLLDSQRLRAARVVLDIGVHLHKKVPEGTGVWDASYAKAFLRDNTAMDEVNLSFELDRYLGWAGQAPSYALGERAWHNLRHDALAEGQTLTEFHDAALKLGSMPMDLLRDEILNG